MAAKPVIKAKPTIVSLKLLLDAAKEYEDAAMAMMAEVYPIGTTGVARIRHGQKNLSPCEVREHERRGYLFVRLTEAKGDRRGNPTYKRVHYTAFKPY